MERTPSLPKKEDSLQREEKSQFLSDLVIKIEKIKKIPSTKWGLEARSHMVSEWTHGVA
jgi:hypothetical protein